jgi:ribosomal protein S27E
MPIEFACASCGARQKADDHLAGRTLRCYQCGNLFTVPTAGAPTMIKAAGESFEISTASFDMPPDDDEDVKFH